VELAVRSAQTGRTSYTQFQEECTVGIQTVEFGGSGGEPFDLTRTLVHPSISRTRNEGNPVHDPR
jgi:hypothetical protein